MDNLRIEASDRTPEVDFDFASNAFALRGESYPEDVNVFYGQLIEKLESHTESLSKSELTFTFELIYFNSSTAKILMIIFDLLDSAAEKGNKVTINWLYEPDDDNMEELGSEYGEDLEHASFNLTPTQS